MLSTASASAADLAPIEEESNWTFTVAPYLWAAGLEGDVGLFGLEPVDVDMSFSDILDNLKFAGMILGEVNNGTWGLVGDLIYVKIEAKETIRRDLVGGPVELVELTAGVETESFTGTLMGEYRVLADDQMTFDLMAGARLWSVDNDISAKLDLDGTPVAQFSGDDGATWVDPMIGAKARIDTGSLLYLTAWGAIGGFGVSSDFAWDAMGAVGYQWSDWFSTVLGYRGLGVDFSDDGFVYDVIQHGVIAGAVMRF
jgi:hypothetical protein